jgi:hypothetical protein
MAPPGFNRCGVRLIKTDKVEIEVRMTTALRPVLGKYKFTVQK